MDFPPFAHARYLGDAWRYGAPKHNLGASAFAPADPLQWLPTTIEPLDVASFDLHAQTAYRDAVAAHLGVRPEHVRPTAGTSAANTALIASRIRPGDDVLCERPHYAPLAALASGFGASIRFIDHGPGGLDADALADAITERTSLVLLTSPNNPTGQALTAQQLQRIGDAAAAHGALVLVDQVYRELTDHVLAATVHPAIASTGSLNKCWGAPGLRAGWMVGDPAVMEVAEEVHRIMALGPSAPGTRLATALLAHAEARRAELDARLAINHPIYETWARAQGLSTSHGDLIAFPQVPIQDTRAWADDLLKAGILVLPGEMFDRAGHLRIGLGIPPEALRDGLEALSSHLPKASL